MKKTFFAVTLCATIMAQAAEPTAAQWSVASTVMVPSMVVLSVPVTVISSGYHLAHYSTGKLMELTYDNQPWKVTEIRPTEEGPNKDWRHVTLAATDKDLQVTVRVPAKFDIAVGDAVTSRIKTRFEHSPVMSFQKGPLVLATLYDTNTVHKTKRKD